MLLAKSKLNTIKVLISEGLVDSDINHEEFVSVNNVPQEHKKKKETIRNDVDYAI